MLVLVYFPLDTAKSVLYWKSPFTSQDTHVFMLATDVDVFKSMLLLSYKVKLTEHDFHESC